MVLDRRGYAGHMRRGGGVVSVLLAVAAAVLALPLSANAAFPGQNGSIAFTTYQYDGNENIYAIEPDGTRLRRLTADTGFDDDAAWSPNGRRIAFASNRAHPEVACEGSHPRCDYDIYVMSADGTNVRRLTDDPANEREPAWSPDGSRIVFTSTRDQVGVPSSDRYNAELYVMNADGSGQTRITDRPGVDTQPAWSPDGTRIVFRGGPCEFGEPVVCLLHIFSVAPGGGAVTQLTDVATYDRKPDWRPDGGQLVFQREDSSNAFWTMNPDGSAQTRIPGLHTDPAWSPDGTKIAFGYPGIGHMNPDGGSARTINASGGEKPDWQPRVGPQRGDYGTAKAFCRAERDFLGLAEFRAVYRSFGHCVSANG